MRLWLLRLGREVGQDTGKVYKVMKVMDEVGMEVLPKHPDTAETWGHSLRAAQNMHECFKEMMENLDIAARKGLEANSASGRQVHGQQVHPDINGIRVGVCLQHPSCNDCE